MTGLYAILLAAGSARRFGGSKLDAPWQNGAVIGASLAAARAAPVHKVIVVTGGHKSAVNAALDRSAHGDGARVVRTHCPDHASGLSASLRCGLQALPAHARGAFIFLGDMPAVPHDLAGRLIEALEPHQLAAAPFVAGRRAHPVLIMAPLFDALRTVSGDRGGRDVLDGLGGMLARVPLDDEGLVIDIDTPADLA